VEIQNDNLLIAGVDPGLASGGLVLINGSEQNEVLASYSMVEKKGSSKQAQAEAKSLTEHLSGWSDLEFLAASLRAQAWINNFIQVVDTIEKEFKLPDVWAIESFVDQRSRAREEKQQLIKNRWHTPLVMGMMARVLQERGITPESQRLIYQNAGIVIRQWSVEIGKLKARKRQDKKDVILRGDTKIRNDHERKALVHALALSLRLRQTHRTQTLERI